MLKFSHLYTFVFIVGVHFSTVLAQNLLARTCQISTLEGPLIQQNVVTSKSDGKPYILPGLQGRMCTTPECTVGDLVVFKCAGPMPNYGYIHTICTHEGWSRFNRQCEDDRELEPGGVSGIVLFNYTCICVFLMVIWAYLHYYEDMFIEDLFDDMMDDLEEEEEAQIDEEIVEVGEEEEEEEEEVEEEDSVAALPQAYDDEEMPALLKAMPEPVAQPKRKKQKAEEPDPLPEQLMPPVYHKPSGPKFVIKREIALEDAPNWPPSASSSRTTSEHGSLQETRASFRAHRSHHNPPSANSSDTSQRAGRPSRSGSARAGFRAHSARHSKPTPPNANTSDTAAPAPQQDDTAAADVAAAAAPYGSYAPTGSGPATKLPALPVGPPATLSGPSAALSPIGSASVDVQDSGLSPILSHTGRPSTTRPSTSLRPIGSHKSIETEVAPDSPSESIRMVSSRPFVPLSGERLSVAGSVAGSQTGAKRSATQSPTPP